MRVHVLPDLARAIASVALEATNTSPVSPLFCLPTRWCEHRPVCAPLPGRLSNGTLGSRYTRRSDVDAASPAPLFVQVLATTDCALIDHLREGSRQNVPPCCRDKLDVACCVVLNLDLSLKCSRIRSPPGWRFSRQGDGRLPSKMLLGVATASSI